MYVGKMKRQNSNLPHILLYTPNFISVYVFHCYLMNFTRATSNNYWNDYTRRPKNVCPILYRIKPAKIVKFWVKLDCKRSTKNTIRWC